ncbi:MAG: amidohydrolase family protein [Deltaproteobacteria bacterium]|nr:amidohydrolase family protein [Deltaproteobacteria bacterium]
MRSGVAVFLCFAFACVQPTRPTKPTPKPEAPSLDVEDSWVDPTGDLPVGVKREVGERSGALRNPQAPVIAIRGATILTATPSGTTRIDGGTIVLQGGAITAIGADASVTIPSGARVVEGKGKFVTPGVIDAHSHIGVYAAPASQAHDDGNEASAPVTAQARAQYAYWPQDPQIARAAAGGVTTALILPGSANLVGGEGFTVAMKQGRTTDDVAFPGAARSLKMACGENPKRVYNDKGMKTRMGEYAAFRTAFYEARAYLSKANAYTRARALWLKKRNRANELDAVRGARPRVKVEAAPEPPGVDLKLDTLASVLRGEILVQIHCYKASDIAEMIAIADELGFQIRSFHHGLEAYKVRDLLVRKGIALNTWADWWGFKLEAFDGIEENAALFHQQGGRVTIHSDSAIGIQRLNQEAAKAMASGRAAGIAIDDNIALRWITANPAWVLGIDSVTGTLETGKRADVTVWSGSPFSVYSRAELTIAGGEVTFDRAIGLLPADFELGHTTTDGGITR